jgi:hypothetical protein
MWKTSIFGVSVSDVNVDNHDEARDVGFLKGKD